MKEFNLFFRINLQVITFLLATRRISTWILEIGSWFGWAIPAYYCCFKYEDLNAFYYEFRYWLQNKNVA